MSVIAYVNQKGGCGKTTASVHFAYWLVNQGKHVLLVDADAQRSSSLWVKDMEPPIECKVIQSPDDLLEQIPELTAGYDYLVVDGPASLSEVSRAILYRVDLAVVPCQPTGVDLRSASDAVRIIKQAQSVRAGPPKAAVFVSRAVKGTRLKEEALQLLSQLESVQALETVIHQKQAIADTSGQSATVWDLGTRPAKESGREYERLFKEVLAML